MTSTELRNYLAAELEDAIDKCEHIGALKQTEWYRSTKVVIAGLDSFIEMLEESK